MQVGVDPEAKVLLVTSKTRHERKQLQALVEQLEAAQPITAIQFRADRVDYDRNVRLIFMFIKEAVKNEEDGK